jgi:hypothetical protein
MMGSLDVTKVHWKNCPTALKGQFQGHEKYPSIGLEAVVDNNYGSGMLHLGSLGLSMT